MNRIFTLNTIVAAAVLLLMIPQLTVGAEDEHVKWYGLGGELTGPKRWFGRIGISEFLGAEVIFGMEHRSYDCKDGKPDCDSTRLDVGAGVVYDFVPGARISPYLAGRFILTMTGNGDSETSGTIEAASGVEYVMLKRIGLSGELNFRFHTDPTQVTTSTVVRFYFYF
jgi:hypothetical protein